MLTRPALSPMTGFCVMLYVSTAHASTSKPPLSLESIFSSSEFNSNTLDNMQWSADGTSFTFTRRSPKSGLRRRRPDNCRPPDVQGKVAGKRVLVLLILNAFCLAGCCPIMIWSPPGFRRSDQLVR